MSKVDKLKDVISSRQTNESTANLAKLRRTYDADMGVLKENIRKSEERAEGLHAWADLQSNSHKKEIETLERANAVLRNDITKFIAKADSESLKLQQELQNEN